MSSRNTAVTTRRWLLVAIAGLALLLDPMLARAATWVPIQGNVRLANGTPVCAMVLANGQYMFSCDGTGAYSLDVPLDANGQITLFAFADGFAPFRLTTVPTSFPLTVIMSTAPPGSPLISISRSMECAGSGWVRIRGEVSSSGGRPLCSLALANGQHMFSCDASLGRFDLTVPLDQNGRVTLFAFADGFQPYSTTFAANCLDNRTGTEQLIGVWDFIYQIITVWVDRYWLYGPAIESPSEPGLFFLAGLDVYDELVVTGWFPALGQYALLDEGIIIDQFYTFNFSGPDVVQGCYFQISKSTGELSRCYMMIGERLSSSAVALSGDNFEPELSQELGELQRIEQNDFASSWVSTVTETAGSAAASEATTAFRDAYEALLKAVELQQGDASD